MQPDVTGPDAVHLISLVSRYAKDPAYGHGDRAALYAVKASGIRQLTVQGRLRATELHAGRWALGEHLATLHLPDWLAAQVQAAEWTGEPLDVSLLQRRGVTPLDLGITQATPQSTWANLSASQRSQLDPRGSWLVSFAEPGQTHAGLHQPYWQVRGWMALPPVTSARLDIGRYGQPPSEEERRQWPLPRVLQAPAGGPVYIDTGMVPVIEALWAAGLQTRFSCQGEPHGGAYLRGEGRLPEALEHAILGAGFQTEISESAWTVWDSAAPWYAEAVHTAFMTLCGDIATQPNFRAVDDTGERYRVPWTPAPDVNGAAALHVRLAAAQRASVAAALARLSGPLDGWSPLD